MPEVNFRIKFRFFTFDFRQNFDVRTFPRWLNIRGTKFLLRDILNFFSSKSSLLVLLDRFLDGFSKFRFFLGEICIIIRDFRVIFENYSMRMLSIRGVRHAETILLHAEHTRNQFHRMLSIRGTNFRACSASGKMWKFLHVQYAEHTRNEFYCTLSIQGTNLIACWAYWEPISSHAEHARKCLKVEYLGRIEYYFQKSRVTGPWDHKVLVSAKKVYKKISCLCTFKAKGPFLLQLHTVYQRPKWQAVHLLRIDFLKWVASHIAWRN